MYDLKIANGGIVNGRGITAGNIYIQDGVIAEISRRDKAAAHAFDARGLFALPGCVDTHCHFRDPGATYKEDFAHGTRAAAAGGVTTVFDMPNTNPPVAKAADVAVKASYFTAKAHVDYALWGLALGSLNNGELPGLVREGAITLKLFWGYAIDRATYRLIYNYKEGMADVIAPLDDGAVFELFEQAARTGAILGVHAENSELIRLLTERVMNSGRRDYEALLAARPNLAEALAVQTAIALSRATGLKLHIMHVSSRESVALLEAAQREGLPVTGETCPHFLCMDAGDYPRLGAAMKVYPPVKRAADREALWQGLKDGVLAYVCSDHAPHALWEKRGDLFEVPAGMCGVETMLPLMLNEVNKGRITLPFVARVLAENQAKLYRIHPRKGEIAAGADADIVLVDMALRKEIRSESLHSKEPFTAFCGLEVTGWPVATFLRGRLIARDGVYCGGEAGGKFIRPSGCRTGKDGDAK